ncbi:hypothetical protein CTAYLR_003885 [Chrysophaeum taylorii]|uniref:ABC transporter domain-containing protein n=1 Tax=Chrysophaeum taylorii TaxID=2483200 RepID=A0AAD7UKJ1_9STRA|nr:hypothetical protein CTAYLR_003885 [Chrysophaeum taylorii]
MAVAPQAENEKGRCKPTMLQAVNLRYMVGGKTILKDVNATFEPCKLTALMGPSGAGKTTMLNTLALRSSGERTGDILVNGMPMSRARMRRQLSYMPQDDILYMQLTVRQLLYYAAIMRCPREWDYEKKRERADNIMLSLGMMHVADNFMGAVSGGQRKRASAAIEFMSGRPLLFMDEPTSGLDSATAKALVERLSRAAHDENRTVICTIHQPSWDLITKFDRVVLLAARGEIGGTVVYDAPPGDITSYFAAGGSPVPKGENPADHLMYVLKDEGGDKWATVWKDSSARTELAVRTGEHVDDDEEDDDEPIYPISYWEQYRALFVRTLHIWVADPQQGPLIAKMLVAINIVIALLLYGMPNNLSKANTVFYLVMVQLTMTVTPLVVIMPEEKSIVLREYRNGVFSATTYWLARFTLGMCHATLVATFTTLFTYPLIGLPLTPFPSKMLRWWLFEFMYIGCVMMLGLTVGVFSSSALTGIKMVVSIQIPWLVSSGILPPLSMIRPAVFPFHYPNLYSWGAKLALTIGFTHNGGKAYDTITEELGIHPGNADSCYMALAICFVVLFFVGLGAVHRSLNRADSTAGQRSPVAKATVKNHGGSRATMPPVVVAEPATKGTKTPLVACDDEDLGCTPAMSTNSGYGATDDIEAPTGMTKSVPIELRDVTYRHKKSPEKIAINGVTAHFDAGSITCLMGPSGAGKTTLLNLLSGRLPGGTFTTIDGRTQPCLQGEVIVDGYPADFSAFKKIGTLTPQDEILTEILTVRQTLLYTAELRSPPTWTYDQKVARVDAIVEKLGLREKAHNVVGSPLRVGISGGQKKRLSIGMDLLAELPVMLVDEPTTGLDASAALNVIQTLIALASDQHRTIICTIHQPPWSMVLQFDQLVLLALGNLVFDGPPAGLPEFLLSGGSPPPSNENPCDFAMVVLVSEGVEKWVMLRDSSKSKAGHDPRKLMTKSLSQQDLSAMLEGESYVIPELQQYKILLRRLAYIYLVDEDQFPEVLIPSLIISTFVGISFHNFGVNLFLSGSLLCGTLSHGMTILNGIILAIPTERELILREFRNGTYSVAAYWFARATLSILISFFHGFPMVAIWYSLVGLTPRFTAIFQVWVASTLNATIFGLFGNVLGLVCKTPLASAQISEPFGNAMILFSGQIITKHFIKVYARPFYYALPISYAFEIAVTATLEHKGDDGKEVLSYYNLHASNRHFDYAVLSCMVFFWIFAGYFVAKAKIKGQEN